jgi:hypothetical protein
MQVAREIEGSCQVANTPVVADAPKRKTRIGQLIVAGEHRSVTIAHEYLRLFSKRVIDTRELIREDPVLARGLVIGQNAALVTVLNTRTATIKNDQQLLCLPLLVEHGERGPRDADGTVAASGVKSVFVPTAAGIFRGSSRLEFTDITIEARLAQFFSGQGVESRRLSLHSSRHKRKQQRKPRFPE